MTIFKDFPNLRPGQPLIIYELNEVPWRVIDWYMRLRPNSAIAHLLSCTQTFTTVTKDEGELHPWTTWPTFHRGVTNSQHNIRFLNQSLIEAMPYPAIWETLSQAGKRVGVFGSLQSYPPPEKDAYEFYIPDTFSQGCETLPIKYAAFQRFNLRQTQQDSAQASAIQFDTSIASDILKMMTAGLRLRTCWKLAFHIAKERFNPLYRTRRSVLQALVSFDIFQNALKESKPEFCTFFTNHVAGMMHRYWKYSFPEDFGIMPVTNTDRFHSDSIAFAMDIADLQVAILLAYVDSHKGCLMIASSMGQEAIDRGEYFGEWRIVDIQKFMKAIDWQAPTRDLLAMQPDFNFSFNSKTDAEKFLQLTARLTDFAGKSIWKRAQNIGNTVNLGLAPSQQALATGEVFLVNLEGLPVKKSISDFGIQFLKRDQGTGYHQPYGTLLLYGNGVKHDDSRIEVDSTAVRPAILRMLGVE